MQQLGGGRWQVRKRCCVCERGNTAFGSSGPPPTPSTPLPRPDALLQELSRRCGGRRLDLVTHSMGGLVVRSLLADFPAEFEALVSRCCDEACMGCPRSQCKRRS